MNQEPHTIQDIHELESRHNVLTIAAAAGLVGVLALVGVAGTKTVNDLRNMQPSVEQIHDQIVVGYPGR